MDNSGNVGIGKSPVQALDVNGNIAVAGSTVHTSDARLKKDTFPLSFLNHSTGLMCSNACKPSPTNS